MSWFHRRRDRPIFAPPPSRTRLVLSMMGLLALGAVVLVLAATLLIVLIP